MSRFHHDLQEMAVIESFPLRHSIVINYLVIAVRFDSGSSGIHKPFCSTLTVSTVYFSPLMAIVIA